MSPDKLVANFVIITLTVYVWALLKGLLRFQAAFIVNVGGLYWNEKPITTLSTLSRMYLE